MSKGYRDGAFALGLVVGGGLALNLFLWLDYRSRNVIKVPPPESQNSQNDSETALWWWRWTGDYISSSDTLAQWIMAAFTITATGILILTLRSANKTNIAAIKASEAALEANQIMRDEQRPWLLPGGTEHHGGANMVVHGVAFHKAWVFKVIFTNFGNSPATRVSISSRQYLIDADETTPMDGFLPDRSGLSTVPQAQSVTPDYAGVGGNDLDRFLNGEIDLVVHARAYYEFGFRPDTRRFSEVCWRFICQGEEVYEGKTRPKIIAVSFGTQQYCH